MTDLSLRIWPNIIMLVCALVFVPVVARAEMARYEVDPEHTTIGFRAVHMLVSHVQGQLMVFSGFVEMDAEVGRIRAAETAI